LAENEGANIMTNTEYAEQVSQILADFRHEVAKLEMPEESWDSLVNLTYAVEKKTNWLITNKDNKATQQWLDDHIKIIMS
jgi:hypothetical protein